MTKLRAGLTVTLAMALVMIATVSTSFNASGEDKDKLPSTVSIRKLDDGKFEYAISGLEFKIAGLDEYEIREFKTAAPNADNVAFDKKKQTVTVTGKLSTAEVKRGINLLARRGYFSPYWDELAVRDDKSKDFDPHLYKLIYRSNINFGDGGFLKAIPGEKGALLIRLYSRIVHEGDRTYTIDYTLSWQDNAIIFKPTTEKKWMKWDDLEQLEKEEKTNSDAGTKPLPLRFASRQRGFEKINALSAYCMCHSRYALRIFDENAKYVWEDTENIYGNVVPMVTDLNQDGVDEIVVFREEHGRAFLLVYGKQEGTSWSQTKFHSTP